MVFKGGPACPERQYAWDALTNTTFIEQFLEWEADPALMRAAAGAHIAGLEPRQEPAAGQLRASSSGLADEWLEEAGGSQGARGVGGKKKGGGKGGKKKGKKGR